MRPYSGADRKFFFLVFIVVFRYCLLERFVLAERHRRHHRIHRPVLHHSDFGLVAAI